MIGHLKSTPPELKEPIFAHFRMRRAAILDQVKGWATDSGNSPRHAATMGALHAELEAVMREKLAE